MSDETKTSKITESVGKELKDNPPAILASTRRKFGAAKSHIQAIVRENFIKTSTLQPLMQVDASGGGTIPTYRNCTVSVKVLSAKLV